MKYSKDKSVVFNQENHTYTKGNKNLISVTTFINSFKNKFDSDYWSEVIAKRQNKTKEEILFEWKEKAFRSTEIGTAIHKIFEDYTLNNYAIVNESLCFDQPNIKPDYLKEYNNKKKVSLEFINDFFATGRLTPIETEYIVYNDFLAGQIDNISKDKENNYYIIDFKTNSKIDYDSYNKKMLGCLNDFNDSSYFHYSLQLSIYKEMIKDYKIKSLYLLHITEEKYNFIECIDFMKEIKLTELIKHYETNIQRLKRN